MEVISPNPNLKFLYLMTRCLLKFMQPIVIMVAPFPIEDHIIPIITKPNLTLGGVIIIINVSNLLINHNIINHILRIFNLKTNTNHNIKRNTMEMYNKIPTLMYLHTRKRQKRILKLCFSNLYNSWEK